MGRFETRGSVMLVAALAVSAAGLVRVDGVLLALGTAALVLLALAWILGRRNLAGLACGVAGPRPG